jgi:hypothetical protein
MKASGKQNNQLVRMFWWTLFTMEIERDYHLPFPDTDIYRRHDSSLGHEVHGKPAISTSPRKISSFLWSVKDNLGLKKPGIYSIPCECCQVCTGQMCHSTDTRLKEYQQHTCLEHLVKAAMAEHSINLGVLHHTSILSTEPRHRVTSSGR